jgi:hypothetical protein
MRPKVIKVDKGSIMKRTDIDNALRQLRLSGMQQTLTTRAMQAQASQEPFLETFAAQTSCLNGCQPEALNSSNITCATQCRRSSRIRLLMAPTLIAA